jgi:hypothetical protein
MCAIAVPICTALAVGGDFLSNYIEAHLIAPARAYAIKHHISVRMPRLPHHRVGPNPRVSPSPLR